MKRFQALVVAAALLIPALKAAPSLSWDKAPALVDGDSATVITRAGKRYKTKGQLSFTPTEVTLVTGRVSIPRQDVKEIVVRQKWDNCCEALWFGAELVFVGGQWLGSGDGAFVAAGVAAIAMGLPLAAVTSPPALVIQAFRHWTTHVSFKVIP